MNPERIRNLGLGNLATDYSNGFWQIMRSWREAGVIRDPSGISSLFEVANCVYIDLTSQRTIVYIYTYRAASTTSRRQTSLANYSTGITCSMAIYGKGMVLKRRGQKSRFVRIARLSRM